MATAQKPNTFDLSQLDRVWTMPATVNWIVPDLIAEGSTNVISSDPGLGKSYLSLDIAGKVAHGQDSAWGPIQPRQVVYIDRENPLAVVKRRLLDLGIARTPNLIIWGPWEIREPAGPDDIAIIKYARMHKPVFIWDSFVAFNPGDEQSADETRDFMQQFKNLATEGATNWILHHAGKANTAKEYRGSSDIKAAVDMAFKLSAPGARPNQPIDRLVIEPFKTRIVPVTGRTLKLVPGSGFVLDTGVDPLTVLRRIVETQPGLNQSKIVELAQKSGVGRNKVEVILKNSAVFRSEPGAKNNEKLWYVIADGSTPGQGCGLSAA